MTRRLRLVMFTLVALTLAPALAHAKRHRFAGPHPMGGGAPFCHIEVEHVHGSGVADSDVAFRAHGQARVFVGDPVAHGYDGPKYAYFGAHPIAVGAFTHSHADDDDIVYCYLAGPHWHVAPPLATASATFTMDDGVYFYVGAFPEAFFEAEPAYARINVTYRAAYVRPVVVAPPPPSWHASAKADIEFGVMIDAPAVVVVPPTVDVDVRAPSVDVEVRGGAGIGIGAGAGGGVRGGVVIEAPSIDIRPPSLEIKAGIGISAGGGVVVGGPAPPPPPRGKVKVKGGAGGKVKFKGGGGDRW
ncbi:MAG: hypothetical protein IT370_27030 [Deltaproteobacteria bacterium]|nr:hypothetical protein [Deltaproteobacteria bacterium]